MRDASAIELTPRPDQHHVDVRADGTPITSYRFDPDLTKPVLYPIYAPDGTIVTRGYPLDPRAGERVDHPHHVGHWLAYGNVNGFDFWNTPADVSDPARVGEIRHETCELVTHSDERGLLTTANWIDATGSRQLAERTAFSFYAGNDRHVIDRETTLSAADGPVDLTDHKEGLMAVRVAAGLEHPQPGEIEVVAADGGDALTRQSATDGRSGSYLSSRGASGTDVWGGRAEWMRLSGEVDGTSVSIVLMDHPDNVGSPSHWHARGYGLFAVNPLGRAAFTDAEEEFGLALDAGESCTLRYRIAIDLGTPDSETLDRRYDAFVTGE